ncbi:phage holin family protein [Serratia fonticola]
MFFDSPIWQTILLNINAIMCLIIVIRLMTFKRKGAPHKRLGAFMAFITMVAAGVVFIRILTETYGQANVAETILNCVVCINVLVSRGNAMQILGRFKHEQR